MLADDMRIGTFDHFVAEVEPRLRIALTASFGPDLGREMTAEALAYGWEHWERVQAMDNPAGYLFTVGRSKAIAAKKRKRIVLPSPPQGHLPWIEPGLPAALAKLTEKQRTVIALHHGYEWSLSEIAEVLGQSKSTVQSHERRGMRKLRKGLGVAHG